MSPVRFMCCIAKADSSLNSRLNVLFVGSFATAASTSKYRRLLSNSFSRAGLFLAQRPLNCDFTRSFINDDIVRVRKDIQRIKALALALFENPAVLFLVLNRILQNFHRSPSPPTFGPRDHLQKLASRLGVSLRGSSEHRSN